MQHCFVFGFKNLNFVLFLLLVIKFVNFNWNLGTFSNAKYYDFFLKRIST